MATLPPILGEDFLEGLDAADEKLAVTEQVKIKKRNIRKPEAVRITTGEEVAEIVAAAAAANGEEDASVKCVAN